MSKDEIALQLTLKAIDRMATDFRGQDSKTNNEHFSEQVCDFYNYLYKNLDDTIIA